MRRVSSKQEWAGRVIVAALLLVAASASGCAMIHSTSISDMAKGPGHRIRAEDTAHGFFMISMPELDAGIRLRAQCAGTVTGVETTTWMRNWFLLVQHYHQEASGWCQTN